MDESQKKSALGRGLSSLIPITDLDREFVRKIALTEIVSNKYQPRNTFIEEKLNDLENSIREHGVIQPIIVRKTPEGYEIIAGERRYIAAKRIGLDEIPAIVKNVTDQKSLELALIENIQRDDLNPIEEAKGYMTLCNEFRLSQDAVAKTVGRSRTSITNSMRLLKLPDHIQNALIDGSLSVGHAKVILGVASTEDQMRIFEKVIRKNLTVRQTEKLVQDINDPKEEKQLLLEPAIEDKSYKLTLNLKEKLNTPVEIKFASSDKGRIIIHFESQEEFDRIADRIRQ